MDRVLDNNEFGIESSGLEPQRDVVYSDRTVSPGVIDHAQFRQMHREVNQPENLPNDYGLTPNDLEKLRQDLRNCDTLISRGIRLRAEIKRLHTIYPNNPIDIGFLYDIVRLYTTAKIKEEEVGILFHYHVTNFASFEDICKEKGLFSNDELKKNGNDPNRYSVRPDVVQLTRDRYNPNGTISQPGLKEYSGDVTFVFKPEIMELPDYDAVNDYPNLKRIPLNPNLIHRVLIRNPQDLTRVRALLDQHGLSKTVIDTMDNWKNSNYGNSHPRN